MKNADEIGHFQICYKNATIHPENDIFASRHVGWWTDVFRHQIPQRNYLINPHVNLSLLS